MTMSVPLMLAALGFGYLFGSVPFGLLFTRMAGMGDVRRIGSGNIGATNVLRTGRKGVALATLLADLLKATVPMAVAASWSGSAELGWFAGLGAFLGHLFPVWLGFRGGKGIATYVGVALGVAIVAGNWWGLLAFAAIWLGTAFAFRISSLAALAATLVVPIVYWATGTADAAMLTAVMGAIAWIMHRANIARLLAGTEPRIGAK